MTMQIDNKAEPYLSDGIRAPPSYIDLADYHLSQHDMAEIEIFLARGTHPSQEDARGRKMRTRRLAKSLADLPISL